MSQESITYSKFFKKALFKGNAMSIKIENCIANSKGPLEQKAQQLHTFLCEKKQSAMLHCALTKNIINKAILNKAKEGMGEKLMGLCNRKLKRCRKLLP